ncbi:helix-turn-helix domain-containing protein [Thiomicrorhabdus sp. ZW0627]|uniref:helix-turn-helix domain-containing protein n=1 Tax=Thiomicrorhabdus sp. ZW0627 TaxID=3039774 RepID=UPI0024363212|nr:helix-turn-helix domain-containing protein [Thiomicrorhabdus sp. ZW0627]MDG6774079.1 helix-turn-helix domain-containing protein [Thiomicrorhabdus sp. ZW0627]
MADQESVELPLNELLLKTREDKKITLVEAAQKLNLQESQLEKFEQAELNLSAMTPFERGYVRNYAHFLGIDERVYESYFPDAEGIVSNLESMQRYQYPAPKPLIRGGLIRVLMLLLVLVLLGISVWAVVQQ